MQKLVRFALVLSVGTWVGWMLGKVVHRRCEPQALLGRHRRQRWQQVGTKVVFAQRWVNQAHLAIDPVHAGGVDGAAQERGPGLRQRSAKVGA